MMDSKFGSRISGGNTAYKRQASDFYPTPPEATIALMSFLDLPKETVIWECACGDGHMVEVLRSLGYEVIATDIRTGTDFLRTDPPEADWIITNPPFSLSAKFIERSISLGKPFAFLLKAQYWHAAKRLSLFREVKPTFILPLTWRPDFLFGTRGSGSPLMDVSWVVWEPNQSTTNTIYYPLEKPYIQKDMK